MRAFACLAAMLAVVAVGCGTPEPPQGPPGDATARPDVAEASQFSPLPAVMDVATNARTPEKVALGRMLYYDTRFSSDGAVSCYVCHPLHDYGTSHRPTGVGHDALRGGRAEGGAAARGGGTHRVRRRCAHRHPRTRGGPHTAARVRGGSTLPVPARYPTVSL